MHSSGQLIWIIKKISHLSDRHNRRRAIMYPYTMSGRDKKHVRPIANCEVPPLFADGVCYPKVTDNCRSRRNPSLIRSQWWMCTKWPTSYTSYLWYYSLQSSNTADKTSGIPLDLGPKEVAARFIGDLSFSGVDPGMTEEADISGDLLSNKGFQGCATCRRSILRSEAKDFFQSPTWNHPIW